MSPHLRGDDHQTIMSSYLCACWWQQPETFVRPELHTKLISFAHLLILRATDTTGKVVIFTQSYFYTVINMCSRSNMFHIGYFWNCMTYCNRVLSCSSIALTLPALLWLSGLCYFYALFSMHKIRWWHGEENFFLGIYFIDQYEEI